MDVQHNRSLRQPSLAAHADWSIDARKRWMARARRTAAGWQVMAPEPVGTVADLLVRLLAAAEGGAVALGVDLPIGVPRAYAAQRGEPDFLHFLQQTAQWPDFFQVCATLPEIRADRPFYPARGVRGMTRAAHATALLLGGPLGLSRACDRATAHRPAGAPLFWTLGANQSGKAAIAAWRDMLVPALLAKAPIRLWPFEGPFRTLLAPGTIAVAETYPAEAMRHLGIRLKGSKRRQADRAAVAEMLLAAMEPLLAHRPRRGRRGSLRLHPRPAVRAERAGGQPARYRARRSMDPIVGGLGAGSDRAAVALAGCLSDAHHQRMIYLPRTTRLGRTTMAPP